MTTHEDIIAEERSVATYAQPLSRLQVSWGSILAGAVGMLAVYLAVWALCLAIILSATHASVGSVKGAVIAGLVTSILSTLVAGFAAGAIAGYLPGNPRRLISVVHGFMAWAVAFVLSAFIHLALISSVTRTAAEVLTGATTVAVQSAGAAVGGAAGAASSPAGLDQRAVSLLESLGYSPAEAKEMVSSGRGDLQQILRGRGPQAQQIQAGAQQAAAQVRGALDTTLDWAAGYMWLWWATWLVAGGLAMAGASMVVDRTRRIPERERATGSEPIHVTTLRPARTMP
jgi:hypothetical protein